MDSWLNDRKTIEKSIRPYAHFDSRTNIANVRQYISNPQKVAKHGFYPFIHYEKNMDKFKNGKEFRARRVESDTDTSRISGREN